MRQTTKKGQLFRTSAYSSHDQSGWAASVHNRHHRFFPNLTWYSSFLYGIRVDMLRKSFSKWLSFSYRESNTLEHIDWFFMALSQFFCHCTLKSFFSVGLITNIMFFLIDCPYSNFFFQVFYKLTKLEQLFFQQYVLEKLWKLWIKNSRILEEIIRIYIYSTLVTKHIKRLSTYKNSQVNGNSYRNFFFF